MAKQKRPRRVQDTPRKQPQREYAQCLVCGVSVPVTWMESHVNSCLDSRDPTPKACPSLHSLHSLSAPAQAQANRSRAAQADSSRGEASCLHAAEPSLYEEGHGHSYAQRETDGAQAAAPSERVGGPDCFIAGASEHEAVSKDEEGSMAHRYSLLEPDSTLGQERTDQERMGRTGQTRSEDRQAGVCRPKKNSKEETALAAVEVIGGDPPPTPFNFLQPEDCFVQPKIWRFATKPPPAASGAAAPAPKGSASRAKCTVLQSGMVLMRQRLSLEQQQMLLEHTQSIAHLFQRPRTAGGGQYHIYCAGWGPRWNPSAARDTEGSRNTGGRYEGDGGTGEGCVPLPAEMEALGSQLAQEANAITPVFRDRHPGGTPAACRHTGGTPEGAHRRASGEGGGGGGEMEEVRFRPNVCNINYYPARASELGTSALGGHQDLDDTYQMPVVSVSVGDSMAFYFRRLPPMHRRESGVLVRIDNAQADLRCALGDAAHNQERTIVLTSGDVLVFGGESRLVYHGTRDLQPGTRPANLKMRSGRLNFTFRQHDPPGFIPPSLQHVTPASKLVPLRAYFQP